MNEGNDSTQPPAGAAASEAEPAGARGGEAGMAEASFPLPQYPHRPGAASPDGRYNGKVRIEGACLYIENEAERVLPVWPQGRVRWSRPGERFLFQGREYGDGSDIAVSGGEGRLPAGEALDPKTFAVAPPRTCDSRIVWFVAPA